MIEITSPSNAWQRGKIERKRSHHLLYFATFESDVFFYGRHCCLEAIWQEPQIRSMFALARADGSIISSAFTYWWAQLGSNFGGVVSDFKTNLVRNPQMSV